MLVGSLLTEHCGLLFVFSEGPSLDVSEGVCAEYDIDEIRHVSFCYHVAPPSSGVLLAEGGGRYWRNPGTLARACQKCRRRCCESKLLGVRKVVVPKRKTVVSTTASFKPTQRAVPRE